MESITLKEELHPLLVGLLLQTICKHCNIKHIQNSIPYSNEQSQDMIP